MEVIRILVGTTRSPANTLKRPKWYKWLSPTHTANRGSVEIDELLAGTGDESGNASIFEARRALAKARFLNRGSFILLLLSCLVSGPANIERLALRQVILGQRQIVNCKSLLLQVPIATTYYDDYSKLVARQRCTNSHQTHECNTAYDG